MSELIWATSTLVSLAAGGAGTWHFREKCRIAERKTKQESGRADRHAGQLEAAAGVLKELTASILPAVGAKAASGHDATAHIAVPYALRGTALEARLCELAPQIGASVTEVQKGVQLAADHQIAQVRAAANQQVAAAQRCAQQQVAEIQASADRAIAEADRHAQDATRAAVRSLTTGVVVKAARLTKEIHESVRRHDGEEAYATFVKHEHLAQQLLLTAQGFGILAGDRPSRHHPTTSITEVIRAAMGRIEGYERVQHHEQDMAIESRAVEAVIHTLAALMDNALRCSPPTANVYVSVEQGHHAWLIHVDDAGLRMTDEMLAWVRRIMSGEQRDAITQLGAEPQTGLRVSSSLAADYGFRVEVSAPNSYQGTRATVVLPKNLIAAAAPRPPERAPAAVSAPSDRAEAPVEAPVVATTASGLAVRRRNTARPAPAPVPQTEPLEPGSPSAAAAWAAGTRRGREEPEHTDTDEGN